MLQRNGTYYAQFYDQDRNPKRRRFSLKTDDKTIARKKLSEWERAFEFGEWDPWLEAPSVLTEPRATRKQIGEALDEFIEAKRLAGRAEKTIEKYRYDVRRFVDVVGPRKACEAARAPHVRAYLRQGGVTRSTQRTRYKLVSSFLRWCQRQGYMSHDPLMRVEVPKQGDKLPKALTMDELDAICDAVRKDYRRKRKEVGLIEGDLIWMVDCFRFMAWTGLRVSETARLKWGHVSFDDGLIYIYKQKNQNEETIPLNVKARAVLEGMERGTPEEFVFHSPRSKTRTAKTFRHAIARHFKRYKEKAEIDRDVTPHSLRHLHGYLLAANGCSAFVIKEALRHASIQQSSQYVKMAGVGLKTRIDEALSG